jgi:hypothetical protein
MHGTEKVKQLYILHILSFHKYVVLLKMMEWDSEVNTVTHYRLDSPGIKTHSCRLAPGGHQGSCTMGIGSRSRG